MHRRDEGTLVPYLRNQPLLRVRHRAMAAKTLGAAAVKAAIAPAQRAWP